MKTPMIRSQLCVVLIQDSAKQDIVSRGQIAPAIPLQCSSQSSPFREKNDIRGRE